MNVTFCRRSLLAAVIVLIPAALSAAPEPPSNVKPAPSLEMISADSATFLHVRLDAIWDSPLGQQARAAVGKEEPNFEADTEKKMGLALSNLATATYVFPRFSDQNQQILLLVTTRRPFDKPRLVEALKPKGNVQKIGGMDIYAGSGRDFIVFVNDRCFCFVEGYTPQEAAAQMAKMQALVAKADVGPMRAALDRASGKAIICGGLNVKAIPPIPVGVNMPEAIQAMVPLLKAELLSGVVELSDKLQLDATLRFSGADDAAKGEAALQVGRKALLELLDQGINAPVPPGPDRDFALMMLREVKQTVEKAQLIREQGNLQVKLVNTGFVTNGPKIAMTAVAQIRRVRDSASRMVSTNNLKQIGLALHNYHQVYGSLPAHAIYAKDGKTPLLSWRVAILPFIEEDALYKEFKLDEPWDSEHNKKLIVRIPSVFKSPTAPPTKEVGMTHYRAFVGGGALFDRGPKGVKFTDVRDGLSNTFMVADAEGSIQWTKPDDVDFDAAKPVPKLGSEPNVGSFLVLMGDGSIATFNKSIVEKTLKALITRSGGETVDFNNLDK